MAAMDLHGIESGCLGPRRSLSILGNGDCNVCFRQHLDARHNAACEGFHFLGQEGVEEVALEGAGERRRPQRMAVLRGMAGDQPAMMQLGGYLAAMRLYGSGQPTETGEVSVVGDRRLVRLHGTDRPCHAHNAGDD